MNIKGDLGVDDDSLWTHDPSQCRLALLHLSVDQMNSGNGFVMMAAP